MQFTSCMLVLLLGIACVYAMVPFCKPCSTLYCMTRPLTCPQHTPGVCLKGKVEGSCGLAQTFANTTACDACCDLTDCYARPPFNCSHDCSADICHTTNCMTWNPYLCLAGGHQGQCGYSADVFPRDRFCSACCNTSKCIHPCLAVCSPEACQSQRCAQDAPFYCSKGIKKGGVRLEKRHLALGQGL